MNDVQLAERTKAFALRIIRLVASLPRSPIADESLYWLELLADSAIVRRPLLVPLCREADELVAIFTSSVKTARQNKNIKPVA